MHDRVVLGKQPRGVKHWNAKLTGQLVAEIRERYAAGDPCPQLRAISVGDLGPNQCPTGFPGTGEA
jgi:hypothetical protein